MKLIVGLGNPGKQYDNTRHNIGFMILDKYLGNVSYKSKFNGLYYEKSGVIFLKPQTYMNNSGECVSKFVKYYNINIEDIMVIQDDLDIAIGKFKFKTNSSSGGHNGIKSIINHLHTDAFFRLKIGILNDKKDDVIDFVLGRINKSDLDKIDFNKLCDSIDAFINNDSVYVMNNFCGK